MKIAVSGVHGVGKTTDVINISSHFNLKILPEQARHLLDTEYPFEDIDSNLSVFMDFQNEVLEKQIKLLEENKNENFVTDRTPIDSLAYVVERLGAERYCYSKYFEDYFNRTLEIMNKIKFDKIFFINFSAGDKIFWKNKKDGQRNLSVMYMKSLNEVMFSLYKNPYTRYNIITLPSSWLSDMRFNKIKSLLNTK